MATDRVDFCCTPTADPDIVLRSFECWVCWVGSHIGSLVSYAVDDSLPMTCYNLSTVDDMVIIMILNPPLWILLGPLEGVYMVDTQRSQHEYRYIMCRRS